MKNFIVLLVLISTSVFAQYLPPLPPPPTPMPVGPCGQVFCPPPPPAPTPIPLPPLPQPAPPAPAPQPATHSAYIVNVANIDTSHWVDISTSGFKMYLDDGDVVADRPFDGMKVLFILPRPLLLQDTAHKGITAVSVIFLVEYNCHANIGRFKVDSFIDDNSHYYLAPPNGWELADVLPSTAASEAVKSRVCFHMST